MLGGSVAHVGFGVGRSPPTLSRPCWRCCFLWFHKKKTRCFSVIRHENVCLFEEGLLYVHNWRCRRLARRQRLVARHGGIKPMRKWRFLFKVRPTFCCWGWAGLQGLECVLHKTALIHFCSGRRINNNSQFGIEIQPDFIIVEVVTHFTITTLQSYFQIFTLFRGVVMWVGY